MTITQKKRIIRAMARAHAAKLIRKNNWKNASLHISNVNGTHATVTIGIAPAKTLRYTYLDVNSLPCKLPKYREETK